MSVPRLLAIALIICAESLVITHSVSAQNNRELEIAARFAPIFYQALGDNPRSDYITNFDFDGDWRGDNNWNNAGNKDFALKAYIYYSVSETSTHYFIHYGVFHPRDYKGGEKKGAILSELIREGAKAGGQYDPTGLADEAALAHENDMEGALVVVKKDGSALNEARVVFVEALHHNNFGRYETGERSPIVRLEDQRPVLYIEPKGHGIEAFTGDKKQVAKKDFLRYVFDGRAVDPAKEDKVCRDLETTPCDKSVGYDLVSLSTLWSKAKGETNSTFGVTFDYGEIKISTSLNGNSSAEKAIKLGKVGCAFLGSVGGVNMARPPWGWFDRDERDVPLGQWFFDPATTVKRDFKLDSSFSTSYVRLPFWAK
jgi:hypothetical protein